MATTTNEDPLKKLSKKIALINNRWAKSSKAAEDDLPRVRLASDVPDVNIISTNNPALDWGLGGGIPEGTIFELFGQSQSGKTTTASFIMKSIEKLGKFTIYYHTEESAKPSAAWELAKLDQSKIIYIPAFKSGEDGLNLIKDILLDERGMPNPLIGMIVIDSISALAPQSEMNSVDDGMEGATIGTQARLTSKMFRVICGSGWLSEGLIVGCINQERTQIGTTPLPNLTSGGRSLTYYPKIRIQLKVPSKTAGGLIVDDTKQVIGHIVEYKITKNNTGVGKPFREGSWKVIYGKGIDYISPIVDEAIESGVIQFSGKSYNVRFLDGEEVCSEKIVGKTPTYRFIENNPTVLESLREINNKVRVYCQKNEVEFYDGKTLRNGKEIDILEEVLKPNSEPEIVEVTPEDSEELE